MSNVAPEVTEADLLNTALVLEHLGHARTEYVQGDAGTVCADGALRLATFCRLDRLFAAPREGTGPLVMNPLYGHFSQSPEDPYHVQLLERYHAAVEAVVPLLPDRCDDPRHVINTSSFSRLLWTCTANQRTGVLDGISRIHHFNDWICSGGDDVADLFRQAAEKVRANT
jgi:hypothetical protein